MINLKILQQVLFEFLYQYASLLKDFVLKVMEIDDPEYHALAIDLYWELLKKELSDKHMCSKSLLCSTCSKVDNSFNEFIEWYLDSYTNSSEPVLKSMLGALLDEVWHPIKPLPFDNPVVRPGIWKSFFLLLTKANESLLNDALQDAFSLLIDNSNNALDIAAQPHWIKWIIRCFPALQCKFSLYLKCF